MIQKTQSLLKLRWKQAMRMLHSVGWGLGLVFLFVTIGVFMPLLNNILKLDSAYAILFVALLLVSIDYARKDKLFLLSIFPSKIWYSKYLIIEYLILVLPVLVFQIWHREFFVIMAILLCATLISIISPHIFNDGDTVAKKTINMIPLETFEVKFFCERNAMFWTIFWGLGLLSFFHVAIFVIWIFVIISSLGEIFKYYESREMIKWDTGFLFNKVLDNFLFFTRIIFLQTVMVLIFHLPYFYVVFYMIICLYVMLLLNISVKYSIYFPISRMHFGQTFVAVFTIISLVPGGVIISLAFAIYKFLQAKSNLKYQYA